MAKNNISKSYLSISSPGVYLTVPSKTATKNATALARRVNDYASGIKAKYPSSFGFFASLPLPDVNASLAEIQRCFTELDPKPDGFVFMSNFYGMYLGDPALDLVYDAINKLGVPIFEHLTTPCTQFNYMHAHIDSDEPPVSQKLWQSMNRPVQGRQGAAPILDFVFDTARTFLDLVNTEVPSRFPKIRWILPHAGGGILSTIDRMVAYSIVGTRNITETEMRDTLAKSFYFDLAGPWPVKSAIPALLRWMDHTKIMCGSDTPFTPWALAAATGEAVNRDIQDVFVGDGADEKTAAVFENNAKKLFAKC